MTCGHCGQEVVQGASGGWIHRVSYAGSHRHYIHCAAYTFQSALPHYLTAEPEGQQVQII